jgi:hypothetical protein
MVNGATRLEQNNWVSCNTPITEYEVSSKGIRHIRTTIPGKKPKDDSKRASGDKKRGKKD